MLQLLAEEHCVLVPEGVMVELLQGVAVEDTEGEALRVAREAVALTVDEVDWVPLGQCEVVTVGERVMLPETEGQCVAVMVTVMLGVRLPEAEPHCETVVVGQAVGVSEGVEDREEVWQVLELWLELAVLVLQMVLLVVTVCVML